MNCTFEATLQWVRSLTPTTRGLNSFLVDHATATTHIILVQFDGTNRACWRLSILSRHLSFKGNGYKKWSLCSLKAQHLEAANLTRPMQMFYINFIRCRQCGHQCFRTQQLKGTYGWIELVVLGLRVQFVFGFGICSALLILSLLLPRSWEVCWSSRRRSLRHLHHPLWMCRQLWCAHAHICNSVSGGKTIFFGFQVVPALPTTLQFRPAWGLCIEGTPTFSDLSLWVFFFGRGHHGRRAQQ